MPVNPKAAGKKSYRDIIGKRQHVSFIIDREAGIDVEARTVEMSILSDQPIQQWWFGRVILDHKKKSVRMDRAKAGLPLLLNHDCDRQIGLLENVRIEDGKTRATARFSRSDLAEEIFQDVRDGIRRTASAGFVIHEIKLESSKDGEDDTYRSTDWEPFEGSLATIPADTSVGVGRSADESNEEEDSADVEPETDGEPGAARSANPRPETKAKSHQLETRSAMPDKPPEKQPTAAELLQLRIAEFTEMAALFSDTEEQKTRFRTMARTLALDEAKTLDDLKRDILESIKAGQAALETLSPEAVAARQGTVQFSYVSKPRNFKGENASERAYRFAMWALGGPFSQLRTHSVPASTAAALQRAETFCREHGLLVRMGTGQNETLNEAGGYTVPHEFGNDLIDLREEYGVFRANAKIVPMASDTRSDPRREGGMTAFWEDETDELEASMKTWGRVGLKAKKLTALGKFSREVSEDSLVNFGDDLAGEIAFAFTQKEDTAGFLGDATKPYGGITGICTRLTSLKLSTGAAATIAQTAGLRVATGTGSYAGILLSDFSKTKAKLPAYAYKRGTPKWYMHQSFFFDVIEPLVLAAGGITADMIAAGIPMRLSGYEVVPTQIMPFNWAIDQIVALFGVLPLAASLGDRRQTTVELSDQVYWTTDEIGIKGTERLDINVHDVGNAASAAADRVPGPIVGLITAHT